LSTAASSEEEVSFNSNLFGFKIIASGKILHDEQISYYSGSNKRYKSFPKKKFASSEYSLPPNVKDIELPAFMKEWP